MSDVVLTTKQRNKIARAVKALNDVRREIDSENSDCDVQWYLENSGNLNLMSGDSHDDDSGSGYGDTSRQDRVIALFDLHMASGGGW
jgi:hypothetical protein